MIFVPAFGLAEDSSAPGQLITVYFIGLAVAQLFFGPLSDWYGRKPVIYAGIDLYYWLYWFGYRS